MLPQIKTFIMEVIFVIIMVLVITSLGLTLWIYSSIVKPLNKLKLATNNIKEGNMDFEMPKVSNNEIGDVCRDFEEMRVVLKQSAEDKIKSDAEEKELIRNISHDLKTPLTAIKGYVEGLRDGIANTPEKQERYLQTIYSSALDMEKLLDELLTLSKLESGNTQLDLIKIDINEYLAEYLAEKENKWQTGNITIKYSGPNTKGKAYVMLDPNRFSRVLNNIISNAVKYSSKARKPAINISLEIYDRSIIIAISDNGIGISEENLKHIFDIFYRADQARTRVHDGSGLGLAVCKEIVELHQGHIWATSKEGHGTTIMISLNREDA